MKQELLEYIIRACVQEVLTQVNEQDDETKGAPAPPADGQGTADQPPVPKDETPEESPEEEPEETPEAPPAPDLKGIVFVSPRDKSKLHKLSTRAGDDAGLERQLHSVAATAGGPRVKTALSAIRMVKDAAKNPNTSVYLYLGKYDPQSDEVFLMADKSLQVAKDSSVDPSELSAGQTFVSTMKNPTDADLLKTMQTGGRNMPQPVSENFRATIKKMVNDLLDAK